MKKPTELKIKTCPFGCGGKVELLKERQKIMTKSGVIDSDRWIYECDSCKGRFTSTESDTISMEEYFKTKNK